MGLYRRVISEADSGLRQFPDKMIFTFHKFCAYLGLGQYDQARATFHGVAEGNDQAEQEFINWSMKYVFDTLAAGKNWHMSEQPPDGAPFVDMNEAETYYKEYAAKGRRLIGKGYAPDWSPDGTKLAYSSGAINISGVTLYDFITQESELLIVPGKDPRWSPDGRHIAFVRDRQILDMAALASVGDRGLSDVVSKEEVWIMRSDGTEARRLALGGWPSWSPDGKYVYYHSRVGSTLLKIAAHDRTASPQHLRETAGGWTWPSVSPDGRSVAWIYGDSRLCISNIESSASRPVQICDFPDSRFSGGAWSPNGRWFSLGGYDPKERVGLWIYDMNQRQAKQMLSGLAGGMARWSADEKSLIYYVVPPILEIWTADIESLGPGKTFAEHDREMTACYTRMIQAYPEEAGYYLSRAGCYSRLNELEKAVADIERADKISGQPEKNERWLTRLKAAHKAGPSVPHGPFAGSMSYDGTIDTYVLVGSGFDIWDVFDECHFAYARLEGDGSIAAKIESVEHVHNWTKAGVMIRNTLDPASQNGIVLISPRGRVFFQWRERNMGTTRGTITGVNSVTFPHWVRLTRKDNQLTAQHSNDGVQWEAVVNPQDPNKPTSVEIPMNETVYIGLALSSHNTTRAAEVRMSNVTVTGSVSPPGPFVHSKDICLEILPFSGKTTDK